MSMMPENDAVLVIFSKSDGLNRFLGKRSPYDKSFGMVVERILEVDNCTELYPDIKKTLAHSPLT